MTPTPDRAAADREALAEWRASRGHVWDREGCQEYSEAAYLAGAEHGRAEAERETTLPRKASERIGDMRAAVGRLKDLGEAFVEGFREEFNRPAPRPDEAEALRDEVIAAVVAAKDYWAEHISGLSMPYWFRLKKAARDYCAALTRASSPAPSPVEAAAGRLRADVETLSLLHRRQSDGIRYGEYRDDRVFIHLPQPQGLIDSIRAVLDALGAKGGA